MDISSGGQKLDTSSRAFGWLRDSSSALSDVQELRWRMEEDGYLYLPGFLNRKNVQEVRSQICQILAKEGLLDPARPPIDAMAKPGLKLHFRADIANRPPVKPHLDSLIYGPELMNFFDRFLGQPARHFDYTWLRAVAPGIGTYPHCDVVYMGRGSAQVYTAWIPFGDVPLEVGGLVLMEGSHRNEELRSGYCQLDVDTACANKSATPLTDRGFEKSGAITLKPVDLRERLGYRFLTAEEFQMGDVLIFNIFLVHGSLDNQSPQIRLSTDSRYQPAADSIDERWIGPQPPAHGGTMIKDLIC